jgi:hypothetical protein
MNELLRSVPMVVPIVVSGILTLAGVYLGAVLYRRTQHGTWLVQKRAEHYEKFWLSYRKAFEAIRKYRDSEDFKRDDSSLKQERIKPLYGSFSKELKITRLFASKLVRGYAEKFDNEFSQWCTMGWSYDGETTSVPVAEAVKSGTKEATSLIKLFKLEQELQEAFERDLEKI